MKAIETVTPEAQAALIGALGATAISGVVQILTTRFLIKSETSKIDREARHRRSDEKRVDIVRLIAELLSLTDPEANLMPDYKRVVVLINHIQLILDIRSECEDRLNKGLNALGREVADFKLTPMEKGDARDRQAMNVMNAQSEVVESTRAVIAQYLALPVQ